MLRSLLLRDDNATFTVAVLLSSCPPLLLSSSSSYAFRMSRRPVPIYKRERQHFLKTITRHNHYTRLRIASRAFPIISIRHCNDDNLSFTDIVVHRNRCWIKLDEGVYTSSFDRFNIRHIANMNNIGLFYHCVERLLIQEGYC